MAFTAYHNITGSSGVDVELLAPGDNAGNIQSILFTNTHNTSDATVTLFIENSPTAASASTFRILNKVAIPATTSLLLDNSDMLAFDNSTVGYGLYIKVGSSDTLDVLIKREL